MHLVQVRSGVADFSYRGLAREGIGDGWPHHPWKARKDMGDGGGDGDARYFDRRGRYYWHGYDLRERFRERVSSATSEWQRQRQRQRP